MSGLSPAGALQKAVFEALSADAILLGMLGGARVYDGAPRDAVAPYVHLGEMTVRDWSTSTDQGAEITFALVAWSREPGKSEVLALAGRVGAILHDAALPLDGWRLANLRHVGTETARADKLDGRRATLRFRAVIEAI